MEFPSRGDAREDKHQRKDAKGGTLSRNSEDQKDAKIGQSSQSPKEETPPTFPAGKGAKDAKDANDAKEDGRCAEHGSEGRQDGATSGDEFVQQQDHRDELQTADAPKGSKDAEGQKLQDECHERKVSERSEG